MSRVDAAAGMDRLPWLPDEPEAPRQSKRGGKPVLAAATALIAVAVTGAWMGARSIRDLPQPAARSAPPSTTVRLPEPASSAPEVRIAPQPEVKLAPQPEVTPAPVHEVRIAPAAPRAPRSTKEAAAPVENAPSAAQATVPASPTVSTYVPPKPWNPRVFAGASGRIVQVGAFGSVHQAKLGWRFMVRAYPAVAQLPAVVRDSRNSHGRTFYRFQVGTTSQAHSEILCQRMQRIALSCAIVGLPWKAKVER